MAPGSLKPLEDQRVLVLGGASGIGRALCERLIAAESDLHILDRDAAKLGWADATGDRVSTRLVDMSDRAAVRALCEGYRSEDTHFDAVVVAAAIHGGAPAAAMEDAFIDRLLDVNLGSHMSFVREILPSVVDGGRIIGISSNCAEVGIPMESAYAATKAGLERYYEALAIEIADRGIRPLVVQVGNVNTGFNETGNDYVAQGDSYTDTAYRTVIEKIDSANGIPPAAVADALIGLLRARRPAFRSLVGMNAKKTYWARRLLGTEFSLRLVTKVFGLNATQPRSG